jgi:hypothetical protein
MMTRKTGLILVLLTGILVMLNAETVLLQNGEKITGRIMGINEQSVTMETSYGEVTIDRFRIERIIFGESSRNSGDTDWYSDDYRDRSDRTRPSFRFSDASYVELRRRYYGASAAMGIGIGVSSVGIVLTSVVLFSMIPYGPWMIFYSGMYFGIPALIFLAVGLPLWIAGGSVRRNTQDEYYQARRERKYYSGIGLDSKPVVQNTLYSIPLT